MKGRKIIHIDMDAFFASVEQRDHPELKGKPVAVGHDRERGVVSTASYEARKFGVHSAMSMQMAKRLCPQLVVMFSEHGYYGKISQQIRTIFYEYTDKIEPLSIDEAFLDVTENKKKIEKATDITKLIKQRIKEELHLTASAGVSYNKFLAKIASDYNKPDGLCVIRPDEALDFIAQLPIEKFWGVGPKTAQLMHRVGIYNGLQLRQCSQAHLQELFGKAGPIFYNFARGVDERPVVSERIRKSVGCERTFLEDISIRSTIIIELYHTVLELVERIAKDNFCGKTLTLKIKYGDFTQVTRSITQGRILSKKDTILPLAKQMLAMISYDANHPIRLIGLSVSNPHIEDLETKPRWIEGFLNFKGFL